MPAVAFSEVLVRPYRDSEARGHQGVKALIELGHFQEVTQAIASQAAQIRAANRIKLPDALIIATGLAQRAEQILTFDRQWRNLAPSIRVLNLQ
ncbi:MAG: type II toxin-antitoxin system VapC family toxin [Candidatus Dormibacteraceae bacterium]